jgi:hypothetical protein
MEVIKPFPPVFYADKWLINSRGPIYIGIPLFNIEIKRAAHPNQNVTDLNVPPLSSSPPALFGAKQALALLFTSRLQRLAPRVASGLPIKAKNAFPFKPSSACRGLAGACAFVLLSWVCL